MAFYPRPSEVTSAQAAARGRQALRDQLARDVEAFLARGGEIRAVPIGVTGWPQSEMAQQRILKRLRGAYAPKRKRKYRHA